MSGTGRSVATAAHPAQLPVHRIGLPGPARGVARSPVCLRAFRGLWGPHCSDTRIVGAAIAATWDWLCPRVDLQCLGLSRSLERFLPANHAGLLAGQLGATYFIPTLIVPLLLITHVLVFRILLQHQGESAVRESCH